MFVLAYSFAFCVFFFLMIRRPPRSTRTDTLFPYTTLFRAIVQGRIADEANILPADSKAQLDAVLTAFDQRSGHPLVIVTTPSLGWLDIARFAATIAARRGMADSGILLLVAPNEGPARIIVGPDPSNRLPDAAAQALMERVILPRFQIGRAHV